MKKVCWELINIIDGARKGDVDLILHRAKNLLQDEDIDWYKTTDEILKVMKR